VEVVYLVLLKIKPCTALNQWVGSYVNKTLGKFNGIHCEAPDKFFI